MRKFREYFRYAWGSRPETIKMQKTSRFLQKFREYFRYTWGSRPEQ